MPPNVPGLIIQDKVELCTLKQLLKLDNYTCIYTSCIIHLYPGRFMSLTRTLIISRPQSGADQRPGMIDFIIRVICD